MTTLLPPITSLDLKKSLGCRHAIYCVRIVEPFVNNGSTVNICALDLSKAFDRMNHYALFLKLMDRNVPYNLLSVLEGWFSISRTCVKWHNYVSAFFNLSAGVRQGGVLSPLLFSIFIDDIVDRIQRANVGCYISTVCVSIFLYADDILLMSPTVTGLQTLLHVCEKELTDLDMQLNVNKSFCLRFGPRYNDSDVVELVSLRGTVLKWVDSCRYLGVFFVSGRTFKCSFSNAKSCFFRAFNAIFSKIGRSSSEETVLALLNSKCLPILLYATEACPLLSRDLSSFEFSLTRLLMKLFSTGSAAVVAECQRHFAFLPIKLQIRIRTAKFLQIFAASDNSICVLFNLKASLQLRILFDAADSKIKTACQLRNFIYDHFISAQS